MRIAVILLMLALISGCKVNEKRAKEWAYNNKNKLAEWCADCFPVKVSEVVKGDTIILIDTITSIDSVRIKVQVDCPDGSVALVDCPPEKTSTITLHTHTSDTIKIRDTAIERVLEDKLHASDKKLSDAIKSRDGWIKFALIGWGLLGVGLLIRYVKKPF